MELPNLQEMSRIEHGMDVCDVDGHKIGSVVRIYQVDADGSATVAAGTTGDALLGSNDVMEVKTGFFGLGKHLFIPRSAVHDVAEKCVFLSVRKNEMDHQGWDKKPAGLILEEPHATVVQPQTQDTVIPPDGKHTGEGMGTWDEAMPHYRNRWLQHYGLDGERWGSYEERYRFVWEMSQHPDVAGKSWVMAQPVIRSHWETRYPATEWDTVSESIRDAWEHARPEAEVSHAS